MQDSAVLLKEISGQKLIGGLFGFPEISEGANCRPSFLGDRSMCFVNARSALATLVDYLSPCTVWLPSFVCEVVVSALEKNCAEIRYYGINRYLRPVPLDWVEKVGAGDIVLIIDFFGFPGDSEAMKVVKERGAVVVEDASHALLSMGVGQAADYVIFSPRKFLGVPDGGILVSKGNSQLPQTPLVGAPANWLLDALMATVLRREFDKYGGDRNWFELFRKVEASAPVGGYAMSQISESLLHFAFNYDEISSRRRENYAFLLDSIGRLALFKELPAGVVPLGFPILVAERDHVQQALFAENIYPPVHWPVQTFVPAQFRSSHQLADHIMTLPCDQRYERADLLRMVRIIETTCAQGPSLS